MIFPGKTKIDHEDIYIYPHVYICSTSTTETVVTRLYRLLLIRSDRTTALGLRHFSTHSTSKALKRLPTSPLLAFGTPNRVAGYDAEVTSI